MYFVCNYLNDYLFHVLFIYLFIYSFSFDHFYFIALWMWHQQFIASPLVFKFMLLHSFKKHSYNV